MEIEAQIRNFVVKNLSFTADAPIRDDASFLETGVIDSMGVMELVAFVRAEYAVEIEAQEIVVENFDSVSKLANFIRRKLAVGKR